MSSSYIVEPQEGGPKKDDTLILMVNDNGVISVDQDTLQNLICKNLLLNILLLFFKTKKLRIQEFLWKKHSSSL